MFLILKYLPIFRYSMLVLGAIIGILGMADVSVDTMLWTSYILTFLTIGLALFMPLINIIENPQSAKKSLIGVILVVILFSISWLMADTTPMSMPDGSTMDDGTVLKFAGMQLWATYFMFAAVLITIVGTEIYRAVKN